MNGVWSWLLGVVAFIPGFGVATAPSYTGYIEAKYLYVGPVTPGRIEALPVKEGQAVKKGDVLFVLDHRGQDALLAAANAQADAADATLRNMQTGGRAEELAASRATVTKAQADLSLAQGTFARSQTLFSQSVITQAQLDQNRADVQSAQAAVTQAIAQLAVTGLPGRDQQQAAAAASLSAARANADKASADLGDRTIVAPVDGLVEKVFYSPGEMAATGVPVVSLLPQSARKIEFFVDEGARQKFAIGQSVDIACDGCTSGLTGSVSFLASDPQFTSPIIYSQDQRSQLVFLTEATLPDTAEIMPGQPVTVSVTR